MKLYTLPGAPNPTKVMLYIAEKEAIAGPMNIEQEVVNVFKGAHKQPDYLAKNPFGTMPTLELDTGEMVFESAAILETLEDFFPEPSLWGSTHAARATARTLERVADGRALVHSATYVHAVNSPLGLKPNEQVANRSKPMFEAAFQLFEDFLGDGRSYLAGEAVTPADCTLQGALQFMRFRELEDLSAFPRVAEWSDRFRARETALSVLQF